jgi:putative intracellular protease/amidase
MLAHLRAANEVAKMMLSVCAGSLLFAKAEPLTGLAATTPTSAMDELRALETDFQVRPDARAQPTQREYMAG